MPPPSTECEPLGPWSFLRLPKMSIVSSFESGRSLSAEIVFEGTHTGRLRSPTGDVPPTGRRVILQAAHVITMVGGRIAVQKIYLDNLTFLGQRGLVPAPDRR